MEPNNHAVGYGFTLCMLLTAAGITTYKANPPNLIIWLISVFSAFVLYLLAAYIMSYSRKKEKHQNAMLVISLGICGLAFGDCIDAVNINRFLKFTPAIYLTILAFISAIIVFKFSKIIISRKLDYAKTNTTP